MHAIICTRYEYFILCVTLYKKQFKKQLSNKYLICLCLVSTFMGYLMTKERSGII